MILWNILSYLQGFAIRETGILTAMYILYPTTQQTKFHSLSTISTNHEVEWLTGFLIKKFLKQSKKIATDDQHLV